MEKVGIVESVMSKIKTMCTSEQCSLAPDAPLVDAEIQDVVISMNSVAEKSSKIQNVYDWNRLDKLWYENRDEALSMLMRYTNTNNLLFLPKLLEWIMARPSSYLYSDIGVFKYMMLVLVQNKGDASELAAAQEMFAVYKL